MRTIHRTAVALSFAGSLAGAAWVRGRWARTLPHVVDTALLLSAVTLAWMASLDPRTTPWLMAKIVGLLVYIGLGVVALKPALPRSIRAGAWVGALAVAGYIVSVAITKDPVGFVKALVK